MKKFALRLVGVLLAASMVAGSVSGCGKGESPEAQSSSMGEASASQAAENFNASGYPIVNEPVKLSVLCVRGGEGTEFSENEFYTDLAQRTNVQIEWQFASSADWGDQKPILLASGALPDMIYGGNALTDADIVNNLSYFRPLNDYIDQYMPNLQAAFEEEPGLKKIVTATDGNIYTLPKKLPCRPISAYMGIINQQWLNNLNLEMPDTIDDLYQVLKAFKEQDANGNGDPNDEIPITGDAGKNYRWIYWLIAPFGCVDSKEDNHLMLKDGIPTFMPTMEEYKEGIKWLNKLYAEGIIDPEFFTQDGSMSAAKCRNEGDSLVGLSYAWLPEALFSQHTEEYVPMKPVAGPTGERHVDSNPEVSNMGRNQLEITKFCEYPEVAARWADEFYTSEAGIQNFYGPIGPCIQENEDGTYEILSPAEDDMNADGWAWANSTRDHGPKFVSTSFESKIILPPNGGDGLKLRYDQELKQYAVDPYPLVNYSKEQLEEMPTLTTDIYKYVVETGAKWIVDGGIDEEWDSYLDRLEKMNLPRLMEIHQEAYDLYMKS